MAGRNLFESQRICKSEDVEGGRSSANNAVFISYSRPDKEKAQAMANFLAAMEIDYYLDAEDVDLQLAGGLNDHQKVVACIESGLETCTHLLGIITENTKHSWWVPYEIGSATGRGRKHGLLLDKDVDELPSYIKAGKLLVDHDDLQDWLHDLLGAHDSEQRLRAALGGEKIQLQRPGFIPETRSKRDLTFNPSK